MATKIPEMVLRHGDARTMPYIGLGTAVYPFVESEVMKSAIIRALQLGYRHIDTASLYFSENAVGEAIKEALQRGIIQSREEIFVTSKLWCSEAHLDLVLPALHKSLKDLQLEYIDLYLIHYPASLKPGLFGKFKFPPDPEDAFPMDFRSVWEAMEECQKLGLTKAIGVSNFSCENLDKILEFATIIPAVNQVEMHPIWQQKKLRKYCNEKGIQVCAYSPLGAKGTPWGGNLVMDSEVLQQIAKRVGKSLPQVCLRWIYEQGIVLVVKSFNEERLKENLDIFDWKLSEEDLHLIENLEQKRLNPAEFFVYPTGPYKSVAEFWDGDV
uniref:RDCT14 n=1 Tax=Piper methysticum TaxID=130404 RepID=A0A4Y5QNM1_9MAGN|nr:RDCT14 [Piper methysticum]